MAYIAQAVRGEVLEHGLKVSVIVYLHIPNEPKCIHQPVDWESLPDLAN